MEDENVTGVTRQPEGYRRIREELAEMVSSIIHRGYAISEIDWRPSPPPRLVLSEQQYVEFIETFYNTDPLTAITQLSNSSLPLKKDFTDCILEAYNEA